MATLRSVVGKPNFYSKLRTCYRRVENISIDYAVLQKSKNVVCIEGAFSWQDVGSWSNIGRILKKDSAGNVTFGKVLFYDAANSVVITKPGYLFGICGLSDVVVVQSKNAILVCSKDKAHNVKNLVDKIEEHKKFKKYL